jgi:hypothetical protein
MMPATERIINPTTGEIWKVDASQLSILKMPEGFKLAEDMELEEWIGLVRILREKIRHPKRSYGASGEAGEAD